MTPSPHGLNGAAAATRVTADTKFVRKYLLNIKPQGCENYGQAFRDADSLVDRSQDTVIIFLCDGYSNDNGASSTVQQLKDEMAEKLSLLCITLGPGVYNNNATVEGICNAGKGKMVSTLNGDELGMIHALLAG